MLYLGVTLYVTVTPSPCVAVKPCVAFGLQHVLLIIMLQKPQTLKSHQFSKQKEMTRDLIRMLKIYRSVGCVGVCVGVCVCVITNIICMGMCVL